MDLTQVSKFNVENTHHRGKNHCTSVVDVIKLFLEEI